MATTCTRCEGTGMLNADQIPPSEFDQIIGDPEFLLKWIKDHPDYPDVRVCDCCGDGETWYGVPGEHYNEEDPIGFDGPYGYNGGLCECH